MYMDSQFTLVSSKSQPQHKYVSSRSYSRSVQNNTSISGT